MQVNPRDIADETHVQMATGEPDLQPACTVSPDKGGLAGENKWYPHFDLTTLSSVQCSARRVIGILLQNIMY